MPVKLVGKAVNYTGKTLWEIVGNLKNYGVGRLVIKSHFLNYPEPSYYKIVKVQPTMAPKEPYFDRRVMVWAEHVFRGHKYPELVKMHDRTFKPKFQLIPRTEENNYLLSDLKQPVKSIPASYDLPPLLKIYLERNAGKEGVSQLKPLKTVITESKNQRAVVAGDDQVLKPQPPRLYAELSVAELTKKLEELRSTAEATVTSEKST